MWPQGAALPQLLFYQFPASGASFLWLLKASLGRPSAADPSISSQLERVGLSVLFTGCAGLGYSVSVSFNLSLLRWNMLLKLLSRIPASRLSFTPRAVLKSTLRALYEIVREIHELDVWITFPQHREWLT
jgi:hypothetical protein